MAVCKNNYLSLEEMKVNAQIIMDNFIDFGWTKESIAGMLGNMQSESTINPCIWESLISGNMEGGYGLVQWTPASKYTSWADSEGYPWSDLGGQIKRIQYEVDNGLQWITKPSYPMSFKEFTQSKASPTYLAEVFINNYERPLNPNQPQRGEQAEYWFKELTGEGGGGIDPPDPVGGYKLLSPYIYNQTDNLLGRKIHVFTNKVQLVKRYGDRAVIKVGSKKFNVPYKNLKKV